MRFLCKFSGIITKENIWLSNITKIFTVLGITFSVFAYFNTVHPVFQKEKKLLALQEEKKDLIVKLAELDGDIEDKEAAVIEIENQKDGLKKQIQNLVLQKDNLEESLHEAEKVTSEKENEIKRIQSELATKNKKYQELLGHNDNAGHSAIVANICLLSETLMHKYAEAGYGHKQEFDLYKTSQEVIQYYKSLLDDPWKKEAFNFFVDYAEKNFSGQISDDDIIKLIIGVRYEYIQTQNNKKLWEYLDGNT